MVISLLERMKYEKVEPNTIVLTAAIDSLAREGGGVHTGTYSVIFIILWLYTCVSTDLYQTVLCGLKASSPLVFISRTTISLSTHPYVSISFPLSLSVSFDMCTFNLYMYMWASIYTSVSLSLSPTAFLHSTLSVFHSSHYQFALISSFSRTLVQTKRMRFCRTWNWTVQSPTSTRTTQWRELLPRQDD